LFKRVLEYSLKDSYSTRINKYSIAAAPNSPMTYDPGNQEVEVRVCKHGKVCETFV